MGTRRRSSLHHLVWALVVFGGVAVLFLAVELLGQSPLAINAPSVGDLLAQYYPTLKYGFAEVRKGSLPLWNPHQSCGTAFAGALHQGFFYPGYAPFLFLDAETAVNVHLALHLTLAALGVYLLCRHFGFAWAPALIAGLVYGYHGSMMIKIYFPDFLNSSAAIPYVVLLIDILLTRPTWRMAALLALVLGMSVLGGHGLQFHFYMLLVAVPLTMVRSFALVRSGGVQSVMRPYALLALAGGLGVLVALVRIIPFGEFVEESWRPPGKLGAHSATMPVVPSVFQEGLLTPAPSPSRARFHARSADKLRTVYVGLLPLALAVVGTILWPARAVALCFAFAGIAAALYSFGNYSFFFPLLAGLPAGDWFRGVDRVLVILGLAVAVLCGAGLSEVLQRSGDVVRDGTSRKWLALLIGVTLTAVVALAITLGAPRGRTLAVAYGAIGFTLLMMLLFFGRYMAARAVALAGLAALILFDLFHAQEHPAPLPSQLRAYFARHDRLYAAIRERQGFDRTYVYGSFRPDDPLYFFSDTAKAGLNHGLWLPTDYETLCSRRFAAYLARLGPGLLYPAAYTKLGLSSENLQFLNLMGVRYFMLSEEGEKSLLSYYAEMADKWTLIASEDGVKVYEYGGALPRAFVAERVEVIPDEVEVLDRVGSADLLTVAFVEQPLSEPLPQRDASQGPARAQITQYGANRVTVETHGAGGMLVFTDQYDPGWRAAVDGVSAPIYRTDYLFRGVPVPPGSHRIEFVYRPRSFLIGAAGTVIGLAVILVLLRRTG